MSPRYMIVFVALATACTTLGPMPATTGVSAVPVDRPGAEVSAGAMPSYFLSDTVQQRSGNATTPTQQLSAVFEPDRLLGTKGLFLGARRWGNEGDAPFEPMIGVRRHLDDRFAIAGVAFGTRAIGEHQGASYDAIHAGGELALDYAVLPMASWLAVHAQASLSATYLDATGSYCVATSGNPTDCDDHTRRVDAEAHGIYTAATAGLSVDLGRRPHGVLHDIRLATMLSYGAMPRIRDGVQEKSPDTFHSFGFSLTIGLGSDN